MIATGIYRHYKGPKYLVIACAETHQHNGDIDVVYISLEGPRAGQYNTRPMEQDSRAQDSWRDVVMWPDDVERHRFIKTTPETDGLDALFQPPKGE